MECATNAAGLSYIRHKDWLGSSRLATTWAHQVYAKEAYAPFGETYHEAGTADRSFTGQDQDTSSGVFDYIFRKQDPTSGRWLSPDPVGWDSATLEFPQTLNRYAYVVNNPMSLTDPNGLHCAEQSTSDNPDAFYYCYVPDASYNGPPPSEIIPPPSFSDTVYRDNQGNVVDYGDPKSVTADTTSESGCVATSGLQNGSTGCGYQFGEELAKIPNWYAKEVPGGQWFPTPGVAGGYTYIPQYYPFAVGAISNASIGGYPADTSVFQIETDPFFSEQQPPPPIPHYTFCHITSKPGSNVLRYTCKTF